MPTIRTQDPRAFRVQADALVSAITSLEQEIVTRRRNEATIVCAVCGERKAVDTARLRHDEAVICGDCLPAFGFCQMSHRYYPAAQIGTFYDGSSRNALSNPRQINARATRTYSCHTCGNSFYGNANRLRDSSENRTVCTHCAVTSAHRCEGCGTYFTLETQADNCCGDSTHNEYKDFTNTVQEGTDFTRFSKRPVGMEIETGAGGNKVKVLRWLKSHLPSWGCSSDGSLTSGGWEYISAPMSGDVIGKSYKDFALAMIERDVAVENQRAGYHVHVFAKDIYDFIEKLQRKGDAKANLCEDMLQSWGKEMVALSRSLVAPWRRNSNFCAGNFAYRSSKGDYPRHLKKIVGSSYPTIAIRKPTLEFRIFPSTANIEWHLARVEFAQKSVDLLFEAMQDEAKARTLGDLLSAMNTLTGQPKIDFLALTLGMTDEGRKALQKMHKCWTPNEYADGKAVDGNYKREPKPRKPRSQRVVVPPTAVA